MDVDHIMGLSAQIIDLDGNGVIDPQIPKSAKTNLMFPLMMGINDTLTAVQGQVMMTHIDH